MPDPIAVAFPVFQRADLLERTLESWSRVRGIGDALLTFQVEPGCDESLALCEKVTFAHRDIHVNRAQLGHAANVLASMTAAFTASDYVVQSLDDYVVATDILELHQWHRERYPHDYTVLGLRSGTDRPHLGGQAAIWRTQLIGALTGFARHKWQILAADWGDWATDQGWWWWINENVCMRNGIDVLAPAMSRADDIGDHHDATCFTPDPPPTSYYEVAWLRETGFDRRVVRRG